MNGADRLCETLLGNGVDLCFANPGTSEMHFVAALDRRPEMRCVLGLFEGVVTAAADGYGRMAEKPAATLLHTGPGLANGLANLHNARRASTPIVNIVGDHAAYHLPFDAPLTTDIESFARPVSNWLRRVIGPDDVGPAAEAAILAARTAPGVATLILPADAAWGEAASGARPKVMVPSLPAVSEKRLLDIVETLRRAGSRAGILLGGSATRAAALDSAGRIAVATGAKLFGEVFIARIEAGQGRVPVQRIPYPVDAALAALAEIDVLVLVGAREPVAFFAYPDKPSRLLPAQSQAVLLGEPGEALGDALALVADRLGAKTRFEAPSAMVLDGMPDGDLTDAAISRAVAMLLPEDAVVIDEGLTSGRDLFNLLKTAPRHDYLMLTGRCDRLRLAPAVAVGAAVGVSGPEDRGAAGRRIRHVHPAGALDAGAGEARRRDGDLRQFAPMRSCSRRCATSVVQDFGANARRMMQLDDPALDWVALANGMGVEGASVESGRRGFYAVLDYALSRPGPFLIEAVMA